MLMKKNLILLFTFLFLTTLQAHAQAHADADADARIIIGRVEEVVLRKLGDNHNIRYKARIDTGAGVSSVHAKIIEIKKPKKGSRAERVLFEIYDKDGAAIQLESDIVAWQNIKKKGARGFSKRPVVEMSVCLGGKKIRARVNLANRKEFIYPLLIGRNILKAGDFLIDPAGKFLEHPACKY
jgi:hypothetical protein